MSAQSQDASSTPSLTQPLHVVWMKQGLKPFDCNMQKLGSGDGWYKIFVAPHGKATANAVYRDG
jgi:hypothetical protein